MAYTINGEAGAELDATSRTLESLRIEAATLRYASLASDTLTWTARTLNATGAGTIVPSVGQVVELWQDGVRRFRGHVSIPRPGAKQMTISAEGPWSWLAKTPLTSMQADSAGTSAERVSFVLPTQSLRTSIISLANRAIALGLPMQLGTVDAFYDVPNMTLSDQSFAQAFSNLLAWAADAVLWWDHSVSGYPAMHVTRRANMTALEVVIGQDVELLEIAPRVDLEVSQVGINYVTRNPTTGRPLWAAQNAGVGVVGKRQLVTVSGPEIVDFLPKDDFDSVQVQTGVVSDAYVISRDSNLAGLKQSFGSVGGVGTAILHNGGTATNPTYLAKYFPPMRYYATDGTEVSVGTRKLLLNDVMLPDWAAKSLQAQEVSITGTWIATTFEITATFDGWRDSAASSGQLLSWNGIKFNYFWWFAIPFKITAMLVNANYPALTSIYKPWEYNFMTPPAGLAEGLRTAQNWTPWEGPITQAAQDWTAANVLNRKVRITNGRTEHAAMDALLQSVDFDLMRGRRTLNLGAPARIDFGTLVDRIRRDPQDNIVYL